MRLEAHGIKASYGNCFGLVAAELVLKERAVTGLIGPNGAGKSTLLRVLSRSLKPQAGVVLLDGEVLHKMPSRLVARKLAFAGHSLDALLDLTVQELVQRGRYPHQSLFGGNVDEDRRSVEWALDAMQLDALRKRPLGQLSHGELRRAWTAVALAQRPDVLLLDEPTAFLDITHQLELLALLSGLTAHGVTVVMSMHDLILTSLYCDSVIAIDEGRIAAHGPTEEVLKPELVREVFRVEAEYREDPLTKRRLLIPYSLSGRAGVSANGKNGSVPPVDLPRDVEEESPH
jgi:iron complex transport system ATP-binding protein